MRPSHPPLSNTGRLLVEDHQRIDGLIEQLRHEIHGGDWRVCQATWSLFERQLRDHIDAEERFLLPLFERDHPNEAAALHEEHLNIRRLVSDVGMRLELHTLREQHAQLFLDMLQSHAMREEVLFYRCAKDLPPDVANALARRNRREPAGKSPSGAAGDG